MATKLNPIEYVRQYNPAVADAFQGLRKAALDGPLDETACELIVLGALVNTGEETSFKVHGRRLLKLGASAEALRQAVMVTVAASTTWSQVVTGLKWVDDLVAEGGV
jgi:alkylhydroperoxidase/carboxymuconolactone decarboxylase family protein YurZ